MQLSLPLCRGSLKHGLQLARRVFSSSSTVPLTAEHYQIQRGDYSKVGLHDQDLSPYIVQVTELDVQEFKNIIGDRIITDPAIVEAYNVDWLNIVRLDRKIQLYIG